MMQRRLTGANAVHTAAKFGNTRGKLEALGTGREPWRHRFLSDVTFGKSCKVAVLN